MPVRLAIDELLFNVLQKEALLQFAPILARDAITNIDHLKTVTNSELFGYGLSKPAVRRLREALMDRELLKKIEKRSRKKKEIKLVDISKVEEYKPSPPPQQQVIQQPVVQERAPTPVHNEEAPSTSGSHGPTLIFKEDIKMMEGLGEGTFAVVKRAIWSRSDKKIDVAVKIIREINEEVKKDLQAEISTMSKLKHNHLIQLYGVVLSDPMLMVMEFCEGGALLDRLRCSDKPILLATQLLNYSTQIASGMTYLEQKGYVHRDLATRNVLLTNNEQQVKICDFGLSRVVDENERLYILQGVKKVPFSWCPPESLRRRIFSSASDVWAFGVTMWELWTYGEEPWIGYGALKVLEATERGERLRRPENAPNNVFDIMYSCWALKADARPGFPKLHWDLSHIAFKTVEAKADHIPTAPAHVDVKKGDRIVVLEEASPTLVQGQNVSSRKYGYVPKAVLNDRTVSPPTTQVQMQPVKHVPNPVNINPTRPAPSLPQTTPSSRERFNSKTIPAPLPTTRPVSHQKPEISLPVRNSLIHAGHGGESQSWGDPAKIPEVYLKNPVINPVVGTDIKGSTMIGSTPAGIPMKSSLPLSPNSNRSTSTLTSSGYGSGRDGNGTVASVEQWARNNTSFTSQANNGISSFPPPPIKKPVDVNFRRQLESKITTQETRPKTTIDLPSVPEHSLPNHSNNKKVSMDEMRRGQAAFQWINEDLTKNKQFLERAAASNQKKNLEPHKAAITISPPRNSQVNGIGVQHIPPRPAADHRFTMTTTANSASTLSTLTLANTQLPMSSTGFSPRGNDPDPFEIPVQAKSILSNTSYLQNSSMMSNGGSSFAHNNTTNSMNSFTSTSNETSQSVQMDPPPVMKQFNTIGPSASKKIGQLMLNDFESRHGQLQVTPQQVANVYPSLNELVATKNDQQQSQRRFTVMDPQLPPPSDLYNSLGKAHGVKEQQAASIIRPRPTSVIPTATNGGLKTSSSAKELPFLQHTPLLRPTVIPGTSAPSGAVINDLISTLTAPKQPIAKPEDKLVDQVKAAVPNFDEKDCRQALLKHKFNVDMAVKQLKVKQLIELGVTADADCAASALDSAGWDLNAAAATLLS